MYEIKTACHSDVGDVRTENQDSVLVKTGIIEGRPVGLFIVADGCGGLSFGDEISRLTVSYFNKLWGEELQYIVRNSEKKGFDTVISQMLDEGINKINDVAISFGKQAGTKVGSTLSLLFIIANRYYIKNIGDSRVYRIRGRKLRQLTQDQSLVADMIRSGRMSAEEAKNFKKKNVLTMCIGFYDQVRSFYASGKIKNGDTFMLCSDGFYNHVDDRAILSGLKKYKISDELVLMLRESVPLGEATDNISVIFCKCMKKGARIWPILMAVLAIAALILAVLFHDQIIDCVQHITRFLG